MSAPGPQMKLFTIAEATTVLIEIEPLVAELKATFAKIRREIAAASRASGVSASSPRLSQHIEERGIAGGLAEAANDLIRRIQERGCVVNGPEAGLIDFPALLGSEIVFLCWKHGEPAIGHWHRIPEGFAGRRPLLDPRMRDVASTTVH